MLRNILRILTVDTMKNEKKHSKQSFGKSFEDAYQRIDERKFVSDLHGLNGARQVGQEETFKDVKNGINKGKLMEDKLVQSERLAEIGTLASGIANEVNNPLAGIMGYAEIMMDENDLKNMKKYAQKIVNEAERASEIIKWLSRYSRGSKDSQIMDVDLNEVIEDSLDALKLHELSCDIDIERNYKKIPTIRGNSSELEHVFVNLIDNAMYAMYNGGRLGISTDTGEGYVEVKISDSGIGIQKENLTKVFEPFFTTKKNGNGTGFGLYVTSLIVKKHNGTIEIESEAEEGTKVTLKFPIIKETD
jgi:two-component system NtrC family sensor kinase